TGVQTCALPISDEETTPEPETETSDPTDESTPEPETETTVENDDTPTPEPEVDQETVTTDPQTEDTLPFTGMDSGSMAKTATAALLAGLGLVLITGRKPEEQAID